MGKAGDGSTFRQIPFYKSYNFKDKDPCIDLLRGAVDQSGMSYLAIHEKSSVSVSTLRNWFEGETRRPQFATVNAVARSIGFEFTLMRMGARRR